ncbi:hypothetical protein, partial [Frankia sp. CiP3]|uniref:hypothetical protein n=1 Tax=Frankia sp. CiP3 TaxID=2880971 RepID=UPI001EF620FF
LGAAPGRSCRAEGFRLVGDNGPEALHLIRVFHPTRAATRLLAEIREQGYPDKQHPARVPPPSRDTPTPHAPRRPHVTGSTGR